MVGMETHTRQQHDILLIRRQVETRIGLSTGSIYRLMREGLSPEPVCIGRRAVRWPQSEIDEWLATRPRATGDRPAA